MKSPQTTLVIGAGSAPSIRDRVVDVIEGSQSLLVVGSFLFTSEVVAEAIVRAALRGVHVYVMTAADKGLQLTKGQVEWGDAQKILQHEQVLKTIIGPCRVRSSSYWHAKFVISDPLTNPRGCVLSSNLNDTAMLLSPEALVVLETYEVRQCFELARVAYWAAESEFGEADLLSATRSNFHLQLRRSSGSLFGTVEDPNAILTSLTSLIESSTRSIRLSTYQLFGDSPVVKAVAGAAKRGVAVEILLHPSPTNLQTMQPLMRAGAQVRTLDWMHAKFCLVDTATGYFTTQNMEPMSTKARHELGLELTGERLLEAHTWFEHWWTNARVPQ